MRMIDLFSGIGGFHLAAEWIWGEDLEVLCHCEKDPFAQKVLAKHWPNVPCVEDIHDLRGDEFGTVDLITGGFPCQPYSTAGKLRGSKDDRALWPEMFRIVKEARPRIMLGENVANFARMDFDSAFSDLESEGYEIGTFIIPACAVDAKHRRDRIWIVAYNNKNNVSTIKTEEIFREVPIHIPEWDFCDINSARSIGTLRPMPYSRILRELYGIPRRVDRFGSLGNSIIPQLAAAIMSGIKEVDRIYNNVLHVSKIARDNFSVN